MSAAEANDVNKRGGRKALRQKSGGDERKRRKGTPTKVEFRTMIVRIYPTGKWVKSLLQKYFSGGRRPRFSFAAFVFDSAPKFRPLKYASPSHRDVFSFLLSRGLPPPPCP